MPKKIAEAEIVKMWIRDFVIKWDLCPFAAKVFYTERVRYVTAKASERKRLLRLVVEEIEFLDRTPAKEISTTIIVVTESLKKFSTYLNFVEAVEAIIEDLGFGGHFQIASFHPLYVFKNSDAADPANLTNRSPYPLIQILREDEILQARISYKDIEKIPENNIKRMRTQFS